MSNSKYLQFGRSLTASAVPESTILVIDVSPSMDFKDYKPTRLKGAIKAACALIDVKSKTYPKDRVGIVGFCDKARVLHAIAPVGRGKESLKAALKGMKTSPCTNITAGLQAAFELLDRDVATLAEDNRRFSGWLRRLLAATPQPTPVAPANTRSGRLIVLGDGKHNTGPVPVPVASELKRQGLTIDVIGICGKRKNREFDEHQLQQIASTNSDGSIRYAFIDDTEGLIQKFEELAHHIRPLQEA